MNRYNNYGMTLHASSPSGFNNQTFKTERLDERASLSGSEDGNYTLYGDIHKTEVDIEEEANTALTSQTLNADGTPKRPMNAFMIFARRRRPQVSSENQAMRTGEISKLLSKEWVAMPTHEKQFYLEQAKHLKDTFNSKYPDYVYRRRPNNSRKRRRSDSSMRPVDHSFMADNADELLGSRDLEGSPTEPDDHVDAIAYTRPSHSVPQGFVDHPKYSMTQSRSSGPPFPSSDRPNGQFDPRMSYAPPSNGNVERFMQPLAQPRHLLQQHDLNYTYSQSQPPHQLQSSAFNDVAAPQGWPPRVDRMQPTWVGSSDPQSGPMGGGHRQAPYSPSTPSSTWSNLSPSGPTTPSTSTNYFPTLNTPFYPGQPNVTDYQTISSPSNSHPMSTPSPQYEPLSHTQPNSMMSKEYAPRVYNSTGGIQSGNSYSYPQRNLPRVQTTVEYPNSSQPSSSSSSSGHGSVPPGFWPRE
ncbi:hypothetical protein BYT27DRAFT_6489395 [Phlegmacium glaucopus]|nr:hypothetical protein BYT27DRAFT_6489395 [Phlegmacium glaucopus]